MFNFDGKVAVVTGGARGIGQCIAEEFKKYGAKVCIIDLLDNGYFHGYFGWTLTDCHHKK